ncbi:MAG: gliding motility-associated ABC transporter ATP-binding subunit GldA [Flavobacteriales bacterium]|nr:gliding motility-associated ABC transporter ATP-binding subunit GldA [Flavobacteriales bacterium]
MSITVRQITKLYGDQKALDNISFEIKTGEIVGFLGPNGAGKSTMMKILTGYIPQTEGKATVCGFDVNEESEAVKRSVGYLPESNPLYFDMYVKEYLEFIAGIYGLKNKTARVNDMVGITGLTPEQHKKIGQLSKGYKQRVGLAQALIHDPQVLILDEPTSGLDPNQLADIRQLIIELGREKTVMLSTHIMQEVEAICGRVIIINQGKLAADDKMDALRKNKISTHTFYAEYDKPVDTQKIKQIKGVRRVETAGANAYVIEADTQFDIRTDLFQLAVKEGLTLLTVKKSEQNLEDVFRSLTKK